MPAKLERCVKQVMAKGAPKDHAFPICTEALQRSGDMKKGKKKKGKRPAGY